MVKSMNLALSPFFGMKAGGKSFNGKVVAFFVKISALSKVFLKKNFGTCFNLIILYLKNID